MINQSASARPRIAIFGDNCLDAYWIGTLGGLSAEAPVPVIKQTRGLILPGMGGNVQAILQALGVDAHLYQPQTPHLPVKNRLVTEDGTQLARWDTEDWCAPLIDADYPTSLPGVSCILVCDYGKGAIDSTAISHLRSLGQSTPLLVDTKSDPFTWLGLPDVTLFPNHLEYTTWRSHYDLLPSVVYKQGPKGVSHLSYGSETTWRASRVTSPRNVCGAGDAVLAAYADAQPSTIGGALEWAMEIAARLVSAPFDRRIDAIAPNSNIRTA